MASFITCMPINFSDSFLAVELKYMALNLEKIHAQLKSYKYLLTISYLQGIMLVWIYFFNKLGVSE